MPLEIDYNSEGFAPGAVVPNGHGTLVTSWDELLWSALTVGRPNRQFVFRHGTPFVYEALFRLSLVRMALEQTTPRSRRLRRTQAFRTLDPTEKGAVNYFLGLAVAKLFSTKLLNAPWLLHLDVFRPVLNVPLAGRSRPDLVGQTSTGQWLALECKGRMSAPDNSTKQKAKDQALRVTAIGGIAPSFNIGAITYFTNDTLRFFWRDPELDPKIKNPITPAFEPEMWREYYSPVLDLVTTNGDGLTRMLDKEDLVPIESADIKIGIHPKVLRLLLQSDWALAMKEAALISQRPEAQLGAPYMSDGIAVTAGESWKLPFRDIEEP
jgi:hypothetical protein